MKKKELIDSHGRHINYLRLAVTDICNLRCRYCMPAEGIPWLPQKSLMSTEEIFRIGKIASFLGVNKIRITGGEPFLRKDIMTILRRLSSINELKSIAITTNGTLIKKFIPLLNDTNVKSINLSLDSLNESRFNEITGRNKLDIVLDSLYCLLDHHLKVKINCVITANTLVEDIITLVELTKNLPITVRFIESMPFNGQQWTANNQWNYINIKEHILNHYPKIQPIYAAPGSTSINFQIPQFKGMVGIIPAYSRTFCGTCNRIRITAAGQLKTCLYQKGDVNLKQAIREGYSDEQLCSIIIDSVRNKPIDGWAAEAENRLKTKESMASIGG